MPLLKLASLLIDCICLDQSIGYINELKETLNQFLEMLNKNKLSINTEDIEIINFFKKLLSHTFDDDAIKRIVILKVFLNFLFIRILTIRENL